MLSGVCGPDSRPRRLVHLGRDLRRLPPPLYQQKPWVLLFTNKPPDSQAVKWWRSLDAHVSPWTLEQLFSLYPRLQQTFAASSAVKETGWEYLKMYFLFHSALALWWKLHGHMHPNVKFMWRVEPDAQLVGVGGWATLMSRAESMQADVLLPKLTMQAKSGPADRHLYTHWDLNHKYVESIEPSQRAWSLVSVGRYSVHFILDVMAPQWANGTLVYEEIFLPTSCLARSDCSVAGFGNLVDARHVRYRPQWECVDFARQASLSSRPNTFAFWHPVKDSSCITAKHIVDEADGEWRQLPLKEPMPPPSPPISPPRQPPGYYGDEGKTNRPFLFSRPPAKVRPGKGWRMANLTTVRARHDGTSGFG